MSVSHWMAVVNVHFIFGTGYGTVKTVHQPSALWCHQDLASMYKHRIVVTNTGQGRPCPMPPCPCHVTVPSGDGHGGTAWPQP